MPVPLGSVLDDKLDDELDALRCEFPPLLQPATITPATVKATKARFTPASCLTTATLRPRIREDDAKRLIYSERP